MRRNQAELLGALALLGIAGGPFLLGKGVDFPDDAIYYSFPLWEWLQESFRAGHSPWFVPGKLGGVSLAGDSVPMGPLYPACWVLYFIPARTALPLVMFLHAIGTLLAVRWLARTMGASPRYATLAGAGFCLGTTGLFSFIDCYADTMALFLWFPFLLACLERLDSASNRAQCFRWSSLAAAALALILLGSHLRWAAATGASVGLWFLIRLPRPRWAAPALLLGLAGGLPGYLPQLLEWRESVASTDRVGLLGSAAHNWVDFWNVAGILAPKPIHLRVDHSVGFVLGCALLLGAWRLRGPAGRLAVLALLLFLTSASTELPGLRYLFAPLLILTHPVNHFHAALATVPAAVAGALCLQKMVEARAGGMRRRKSKPSKPGASPGHWLLGFVFTAMLLRAALPDQSFHSDFEWGLYLLALLQAVIVGGVMVWMVRRGGPRLGTALVTLALVDLALIGVRLHTALPSTTLPLSERQTLSSSSLEGGFLHLTELADLEPFQYGSSELPDAQVADDLRDQSSEIEMTAEFLQEDLLTRRWPVHLGMAHGLRSGSGFSKMPPRRAIAMLSPLADALVSDSALRHRLQEAAPEEIGKLFARSDSLGSRTLALLGLQSAIGPDTMRFEAHESTPRCFLPSTTQVVTDESERIRLLLHGQFSPHEHALLEAPLARTLVTSEDASVDCSLPHRLEVQSKTPTLTVLRERHHPGWRVETADGERLETFPVNQVHLGVIAPGESSLKLTFVPPGLEVSMAASSLAWLLITLGLFRGRLNSISTPAQSEEKKDIRDHATKAGTDD